MMKYTLDTSPECKRDWKILRFGKSTGISPDIAHVVFWFEIEKLRIQVTSLRLKLSQSRVKEPAPVSLLPGEEFHTRAVLAELNAGLKEAVEIIKGIDCSISSRMGMPASFFYSKELADRVRKFIDK